MRRNLILKLKFYKWEFLLFGAVFLLMIIRFWGLFQNAALPGWDAPSHFFALSKMANEYLPQGHVTGYLWEWLGGMPLFQFYPPLYFVIVSVAWFATFKLIPLFLFFRISIFAVCFGVVLSLWHFARTFWGRDAGLAAIFLSPVFLFYPRIYSLLGTGAGAALWAGLIPSVLGLSLVFLCLSFLEKMKQKIRAEENFRPYFIFSALSVFALAFTHTISFIAGGFLFGAYILWHWREWEFFKKAVFSFLLGVVLASFWLIPFLSGLDLTSGEILGAGEMREAPFFILFPFKINYLSYGAAGLLALFVSGVYFLVKEKKFLVPYLFFCLFLFFFLRIYFAGFFPEFSMHYNRFLPFLYFLITVVASYALWRLWEYAGQGERVRKIVFGAAAVFLVFDFFAAFDMKIKTSNFMTETREPVKWSFSDFEYANAAQKFVVKMRGFQDVRRIFVQFSPIELLAFLGSLQHFISELPARNGQAVIEGLYVESAPLTPFVMPLIETLTAGETQAHGDMRLMRIKPFFMQDTKLYLERLGRLGVNYIAARSRFFASRLENTGMTELADDGDFLKIFRLKESKPLIYPSEYKPALFLSIDGKISFRDFSTALFAGENTFDFPVAEGKLKLDELNEKTLADFSFVVIGDSEMNPTDTDFLKKLVLSHPVIVLKGVKGNNVVPAKISYSGEDEKERFYFIDGFEIISKLRRDYYESWPAGWEGLFKIIVSLKDDYRILDSPATVIKEINSREIRFSGFGPVIVNAGYSPYWQNESLPQNRVFQVSPAEMLIFAEGDTVLEYKADGVKKFSMILSALAWVGLIWYVIYSSQKSEGG